MAVKMECDRCHKQWTPVKESHVDNYSVFEERCSIQFTIPPNGRRVDSIQKAMDMCQSCARALFKMANETPPQTG